MIYPKTMNRRIAEYFDLGIICQFLRVCLSSKTERKSNGLLYSIVKCDTAPVNAVKVINTEKPPIFADDTRLAI